MSFIRSWLCVRLRFRSWFRFVSGSGSRVRSWFRCSRRVCRSAGRSAGSRVSWLSVRSRLRRVRSRRKVRGCTWVLVRRL